MSQLYPANFAVSTQGFPSDQTDGAENGLCNGKPSAIAFHPIIPKVLTKNVLSSTTENMQQLTHSNTNGLLSAGGDQQDQLGFYHNLASTYRSLSYVVSDLSNFNEEKIIFRSVESNDLAVFDDDLPVHKIFFSVSGSTYRHRTVPTMSIMSNNRFRLCLTAPFLEKLHEVSRTNSIVFLFESNFSSFCFQTLKLIDHRVVKYLDKVAIAEYNSLNRASLHPTSVSLGSKQNRFDGFFFLQVKISDTTFSLYVFR